MRNFNMTRWLTRIPSWLGVAAILWATLTPTGAAWARTVKFYDNLKFVYQIQTTLREWQQDQETQQPAPESDQRQNKPDGHRLPVRNPGPDSARPSKLPGGTQ